MEKIETIGKIIWLLIFFGIITGLIIFFRNDGFLRIKFFMKLLFATWPWNRAKYDVYQRLYLIGRKYTDDKLRYRNLKIKLKASDKSISFNEDHKMYKNSYLEFLESYPKLIYSSLDISPIDYKEVLFFSNLFNDKPEIEGMSSYQYLKVLEYGRYKLLTPKKGRYSTLLLSILDNSKILDIRDLSAKKKLEYWLDLMNLPQDTYTNTDLINKEPLKNNAALDKINEIYKFIEEIKLEKAIIYIEKCASKDTIIANKIGKTRLNLKISM